VVLNSNTHADIRQEIFSRVNRSGQKVNDSEFRRGTFPGPLTNFINKCTANPLFVHLCPLPQNKENRYERFELILRFFAYVNQYESFVHQVAPFLDLFLVSNQDTFDENRYRQEFDRTCQFVYKHFPYGFAKTASSTTTPRVRFEAISVGVALALRENPNLNVESVEWLNSDEFATLTTSDASNNQGKLKKRVEYVKNMLLYGHHNE